MPSTPAFDLVAEGLERETHFDRLAARGTVRLVLRGAGLDAYSVTAAQMVEVVRRHLQGELECRGVEDAATICESVAARLVQLERTLEESGEHGTSLFSTENLGKPR